MWWAEQWEIGPGGRSCRIVLIPPSLFLHQLRSRPPFFEIFPDFFKKNSKKFQKFRPFSSLTIITCSRRPGCVCQWVRGSHLTGPSNPINIRSRPSKHLRPPAHCCSTDVTITTRITPDTQALCTFHTPGRGQRREYRTKGVLSWACEGVVHEVLVCPLMQYFMCLRAVKCNTPPLTPCPQRAWQSRAGLSLCTVFFLSRTAPRDHQSLTAHNRQPPTVVQSCFCGLVVCPCLDREYSLLLALRTLPPPPPPPRLRTAGPELWWT